MKRKNILNNASLYSPILYRDSFSMPLFYDNNIDDRYFFSNFHTSFLQERAKALEKNIPVTYIEGSTIFKTSNGFDKEAIGSVSPMIKVTQRLFKIK